MSFPVQSVAFFQSLSSGRLAAFGILSLAAGFVFSALDQFQDGFIRDDTLIIGSFALFTAATLWTCKRFGVSQWGNVIVRAAFVAAVCVFAVLVVFWLVTSERPVVVLLLSLFYTVFLYPIWVVTWGATLKDETSSTDPNAA